jgi:hypothetical protein
MKVRTTLPILHRTLDMYDSPVEVNLSSPRLHLCNLWISMARNLRALSVPTTGKDSRLGFLFYNYGRRQLVGAYALLLQGRPVFTFEQVNLALAASICASAAGNLIEVFFAAEAVAFVVHPCIFNCQSSSGFEEDGLCVYGYYRSCA